MQIFIAYDHTQTSILYWPWVVIIDFAKVGAVLAVCSLFEFVIAQTPNRMRGIMLMVNRNGFGVWATCSC